LHIYIHKHPTEKYPKIVLMGNFFPRIYIDFFLPLSSQLTRRCEKYSFFGAGVSEGENIIISSIFVLHGRLVIDSSEFQKEFRQCESLCRAREPPASIPTVCSRLKVFGMNEYCAAEGYSDLLSC